MATGDTDIKICSDALLMLGANPISSFTDNSTEALITNTLYEEVVESTLSPLLFK